MITIHHLRDVPESLRGCAVAIGNFDGVHLGHRTVINEAGLVSRNHNLPWAVMTFEPHPRNVFKPDLDPFRLSPLPIKERLIADMGVDALIVMPFSMDFAQTPAESFVDDVLVSTLGARHVVCGYDFHFGHKRRGNRDMLLKLGAELGYGFTCVSEVCDEEGGTYASTNIRNMLVNADPVGAAEILGRPFEIEGKVRDGDKRGRTIGFPTCNIEFSEYLVPTLGVYAVRVAIGEQWYDGVANIGKRPTFDKRDVLLEVHLFDFDGDLYGQNLRVQLIDFVRHEQKFDGIGSLKAQISADCETAREALQERS